MKTFQRSADTDRLILALEGVNGEISYKSLATQTALTPERVHGLLPGARRALLRKKIMFGTIRGIGLKRLSEPEKVDQTDARKKRISNAARRGVKETSAIDPSLLSNQDQIRNTTNRTIFSLIAAQTAPVKVSEPPTQAPQPPQLPEVAKLVRVK